MRVWPESNSFVDKCLCMKIEKFRKFLFNEFSRLINILLLFLFS